MSAIEFCLCNYNQDIYDYPHDPKICECECHELHFIDEVEHG